MLRFEIRPMTPAERKTLLRFHRCHVFGRFFFYFILYVLGILLGITFLLPLFYVLIKAAPDVPQRVFAFACLAGTLAGSILLYRKMRQREIGYHVLEDLSQENIEAWHIESRDVIQIGSDDGPAWFFKTGDAEIVFLAEWDLSCKLDLRKFPNQSFTFVRYPHSQLITRLTYEGVFLKPKLYYNAHDPSLSDCSVTYFQVLRGDSALKIMHLFLSDAINPGNASCDLPV